MEKRLELNKFSPTDYEDSPFYTLLRQLPAEIARKAMTYADNNDLNDDDITSHLKYVISGRNEAMTSSEISDPHIREIFRGDEAKLFRALETSVFNNPNNYLGAGMTAKVKLYEVQKKPGDTDTNIKMAVKYVVTPTAKTISAEQEHNVVMEVERMRMIEKAEKSFPRRSHFIRVPHPFLYHKTADLQLYGMECIDGMTLEQINQEGMFYSEMKESLKKSPLAKTSPEELDGYIKRFFDTMHELCLHGDIKPKNIMISRDGVIYIIDFGQSVMSNNMPAGSEDAFENLKADEIKSAQTAIKITLRKIFED